jgi:hypothetical protein
LTAAAFSKVFAIDKTIVSSIRRFHNFNEIGQGVCTSQIQARSKGGLLLGDVIYPSQYFVPWAALASPNEKDETWNGERYNYSMSTILDKTYSIPYAQLSR